VAQDVILNHRVFAKAGDPVQAVVSNVAPSASGPFARMGAVETVSISRFINFCGDTLHLGFTYSAARSVKGGIFGARMGDAVIAKGTVFLATTDRVERKICSEKTSAAPGPLPAVAVTPNASARGAGVP
jgi:hypothetical protein